MCEKYLVSIIVPIYNVETYVERCVGSLIRQKYKNIEIILVDDGSTDDSGKICDELLAKDSRIRVIHQKNMGLSKARNNGILLSKGEYVAVVDSDDYVSPEYIEIMLFTCVNENCDIAICNYVKGKEINYTFKNTEKLESRCLTSEQMLNEWHGENKDIETSAWNKLYRRKLFVEGNVWYPEGKYYEDTVTTHRLVARASRIAIIDAYLYYYYQRESSIMHSSDLSESRSADWIEMQETRTKWFCDKGYVEAYRRLAVKLMKYYMLIYCRLPNASKLKENIMKRYCYRYNEVLNYASKKDKVLFQLFVAKPNFFSFGYSLLKCFKLDRKITKNV